MKTFISFLIIILCLSCETEKESKSYTVKYFNQSGIVLDGDLSETAWTQANIIADFSFPWEDRAAPITKFRAFYDSVNFYFSFETFDTTLVIIEEIEDEEDLIKEDRVELYFAFDDKLNKSYYCIEIDPTGRILDYVATFPRQFDFSWNWQSVQASASITENGYIVESFIPLKTLKDLGYPINRSNTVLKAAVFRAEFRLDSQQKLEEHWLSWIDPHVDKPDYHVPGSFGDFNFQNRD